ISHPPRPTPSPYTTLFRSSVIFSTPDPTGGNRLVYDVGSPLNPLTGVGLAGTQYVAELYVGANTGSLTPLTTSISHFRSTTSAKDRKSTRLNSSHQLTSYA